ncbi:MAG: GNAT family N-acetyltransferase [Lachnospiraceae bacterium]|nr:GNAT family N-acetyltransferase [Lachnospiraceae bacterium]
MAISVVTFGEKELELLQNYIPDGLLTGFGLTHIFGAVEGEEIKGFEVVRQTDDDAAVLTWIYVFEEYRKQGIGNALLDYIVKQVEPESDQVLFVEYPAEIDDAKVLDYMLARRDFDIWEEAISIGEIDRYLIRDSFLAEQDTTDEFDADIFRLEEVPTAALNDFMDKNEGLTIHDFDIYNADKVLSLVLAKDGNMKGILLITPDEKLGEYIISNLYVEKKAVTLVMGFLTRALDYLINTDNLIQKLKFLAQDEQAKDFIDHALSNRVVWETEYVKRASLTGEVEI